MHYLKITSGETIIEFHNNWLGVETVIVEGQQVSKMSSIMGCDHPFQVVEGGVEVKYILCTKVGSDLQVKIDLIRSGEMVQENLAVPFGGKPGPSVNREKQKGLEKLKEYELEDALAHLSSALDFNLKDGEIHFHMACAYSVMERSLEGFESLRLAVQYNLQDKEAILNHDMLAFIRMHPAFEGFLATDFGIYELALFNQDRSAQL